MSSLHKGRKYLRTKDKLTNTKLRSFQKFATHPPKPVQFIGWLILNQASNRCTSYLQKTSVLSCNSSSSIPACRSHLKQSMWIPHTKYTLLHLAWFFTVQLLPQSVHFISVFPPPQQTELSSQISPSNINEVVAQSCVMFSGFYDWSSVVGLHKTRAAEVVQTLLHWFFVCKKSQAIKCLPLLYGSENRQQ